MNSILAKNQPPQCSVKRHCESLQMLVRTLRSLGLDGRDIGAETIAAFEEYERELLHTLGQMMGERG